MAEETKVVEQPHSCKIAVNAKGQWSGEVKVYADSSVKALEVAKLRAEELAETISKVNNPGSP